MYGALPAVQAGLPRIDADPQKALNEAYTEDHRRCFPAPVLPEEYRGAVDLGWLAVAGPYACYLERAPEGGYHWDLRQLARYEHHQDLYSLGVRVLFRLNEQARKLEAAQVDCELGSCLPGDANWELAKKIALCAVTTHVSLVRHFNWVHLAAAGPFAIARRNCFPAGHPLRRLLWPHMFGTQYSNQIVTKGQMAKAGDFEINPDASLHPPKDFVPNEYRGFLKGDRFHYTVRERPDHKNPPQELVSETQEDEMRAVRLKDLPPREADPAE